MAGPEPPTEAPGERRGGPADGAPLPAPRPEDAPRPEAAPRAGEGPRPDGAPGAEAPPPSRARAAFVVGRKVASALLALAVFIFAIGLLKAGAGSLAPVLRGVFRVDDPAAALGFGWILAELVMSGSPIAATALGLYAVGALNDIGAYLMIAGSRLGAAFIVLFLGFVYAVRRGHHRRHVSLHAGVLSLLVTYTIYAPGVVLGYVLLASGVLEPYTVRTPPSLVDFLDNTFGAAAARVAALAPHPALVFFGGIGVVLVAFKLFDLALPDIQKRAGKLGGMAERIYRPSIMFAFGLLVTLLTLSVSVSLGLLVPLTVKGIVRRENLIPYIMGANVSTFIDTLMASIVVGGAGAFTLVLANMVGVAAVSVAVIALGYGWYEAALWRASHAVLHSNLRLGLFVTVILICPLVLLLL